MTTKMTKRANSNAAVVYRADHLLTADIPKRQPIVVLKSNRKLHMLCVREILEIVAARGVGKSMFGLSLGIAIATAIDYLCWKVYPSMAKKVLYIDGEMPGFMVQERMIALTKSMGVAKSPLLRNLAYVARDFQDRPMPRLDTAEGQMFVSGLLDHKNWDYKDEDIINNMDGPTKIAHWGAQVVILDNAACLFNPAGEVHIEEWVPAQEWLLSLRDKGITVILIHHAGVAGDRGRGSSAKEDAVDTTLLLQKLPGKKPKDITTRFKASFTKGRSLFGDAEDGLTTQYHLESGWSWKPVGRSAKPEEDDTEAADEEGMTPLEGDILKVLMRHGALSSNGVNMRVKGHKPAILEALRSLQENDKISKKDGFWGVV